MQSDLKIRSVDEENRENSVQHVIIQFTTSMHTTSSDHFAAQTNGREAILQRNAQSWIVA